MGDLFLRLLFLGWCFFFFSLLWSLRPLNHHNPARPWRRTCLRGREGNFRVQFSFFFFFVRRESKRIASIHFLFTLRLVEAWLIISLVWSFTQGNVPTEVTFFSCETPGWSHGLENVIRSSDQIRVNQEEMNDFE